MRILLLFVALLLAIPADAQVRKGLQEFNGSGTAGFVEDASFFVIGVNYGYFVTRMLEVGPSIQISHLRVDTFLGSESTTSGVIGGFGHVHFGRQGSTAAPFAGVEIGAAVGEADGAQFALVAGGKFFVAQGAAITPAAVFQFDDDGNSQFGARFGVSAFF